MNRLPFAVILLLAAFTAFLAPSNRASAASYVVDTAADDPAPPTLTACTGAAADCSLRGAITNANAAASPGDVITFDAAVFPSGTPTSIVMTAQMALATAGGGGDTIDGTGAGVILDGGPDIPVINCLQVLSAGNTIRNLRFTDCVSGINLNNAASDDNVLGPGNVIYANGVGILIQGSSTTGNIVKGSFIGTTADGTAVNGEGGNNAGILISSPSNTIGGITVADRNIISGNNGDGIRISSVSNNDVFGNYIGTDVTGTVDLGNGTGVNLQTASFTDIGGTLPGQSNLISGNGTGNNISVQQNSFNNRIVNNYIGPDVTGIGVTMTNGGSGINVVNGSVNNEIAGNLVGDNITGIVIQDPTTNGNVVKGNSIGTGPGGPGVIPNSVFGIWVNNGAYDNTIGGVLPGEGNVIAENAGTGVLIQGAGTTGNSIRGNSIHDNGGTEISLLAGGNNGLAAPTIAEAGLAAVAGTACANCTVDVFSDGVADAESYEGTTAADGAGNWALFDERALAFWTATATDASGNTSGLSAALASTTDTDADGIPDLLDNCYSTANGPGQSALLGIGNQADADGDGLPGSQPATGSNWGGDACDADDDNDDIPDTMDICRTQAEDYDGYQDGDTCPDADNDSDGICDDGLFSVSCIGSDTGKSCFDPAGTLACHLAVASDCRNIAEDQDGFKDGDGCPEPDNDNDAFPDHADDCPGTNAHTGPDGMLGSPQDLNHNGIQDGGEAALTSDDLLNIKWVFEDYDGVLDTDGCHDSPGDDFDGDGFNDDDEVFIHLTDAGNPDTDTDTVVDGTDNCPNWPNAAQNVPVWVIPANDSDCDGFTVAREQWTGTNPTKHCNNTSASNDEPNDAWPSDFNDSRLTSLADVVLMSPVYNQSTGADPAKRRFDLNASGLVSLADVVLMGPFYNKSCA